ncbi:PAS domain S-box protein [Archangium sp.]|uniref:PAS domain S-box protein n=1 Tax=Archangium sp. TaxID=1872627 RepID=UPI002D4956B7|nr:PAS domain S-box protein [Archangium sp.]HYO56271.1 PAS domain S-box protein [Archangium sp.]
MLERPPKAPSERSEHEPVAQDPILRARMLEHSTVGLAFLGADSQRLEAMNPAFARMHGHTLEELTGRPLLELCAPEARDEVERNLRLVRETGRHTFEALHVHGDGSTFPVLLELIEVQDAREGPAGHVLNAFDLTRQKALEAALRESERRFHRIIETAREGIWTIDVESRTNYANQRMAEMLGYTVDEMLGMSMFDFMDEEGRLIAARNVERRKSGIVEQHDFKLKRKDGSALWTLMETNPILGPDGGYEGALAMVTDITARVNAERELRRSEESLAMTLRSIGDAVISTDEQGRIVLMNPIAEKLTGWSRSDARGRPVEEILVIVNEETRAPVESPARKILREGALVGLANHALLIARDGTERPIADSGAPIRDASNAISGVVLVFRDQTEERRHQDQLRRSEQRLREAQRLARLGSWEWDLHTHQVTWSDELYRIHGLQPQEVPLTHDSFLEKLHPEDRERVDSALMATARTAHPFAFDHRIVRPDGTVRVLHTQGDVFLDTKGKPIRLVGTGQDITERKEMEGKLMLSDRLASLGTLAGGVAHEINNPLSFVASNLEFISTELQTLFAGRHTQQVRELLEAIQEARHGADRVRRIVRDLKAFSRPGDESFGPTDVNRVLEFSIKMTWNELRHRARLVRELGEVPPVQASESRLSQVFVNLLVNAAQAIPEGNMEKNEIRLHTRERDGRVIIEIQDSGHGIPPDVRQRMFDPFFTTKPAVGTGLGLSICHSIVTTLGGEIQVESQLGHGALFRVVLPASPVATTASRLEHEAPPPPPARRSRVLIIDDEPMVGKSIRRILASEHDVEVIARAGEAIARISAGERFDAILCDLLMPDVSGMDVYQMLSEVAPDQVQRIIFMTGGAFTAKALEFLNQVPNQKVDKPIDFNVLRMLIRKQMA